MHTPCTVIRLMEGETQVDMTDEAQMPYYKQIACFT